MPNNSNLTTRMYQFLASFNSLGGWQNVADSSHGNGDGTVIKAEFRRLVNSEWDGERTGLNDLIDNFWNSIDTNTGVNNIAGTRLRNKNALDENEMQNLDKALESYIEFEEYVQENVNAPSCITTTASQWQEDVVGELSRLLEQFLNNGSGNLTDYLNNFLAGIQNKYTAKYVAIEYQTELRNGSLAQFSNYNIAEDETLQALISNYLTNVTGEMTADEIRDSIRAIIDSYISTAGLNSNSTVDLTQYGYNPNELNDLQIAVVVQKLKMQLSNLSSQYAGYEDEFTAALEAFIENKISSLSDSRDPFRQLMNIGANEFINSDYKRRLDLMVTARNYSDLTADVNDRFYALLAQEIGADAASIIAENDIYSEIYQGIIEEVIQKIKSGEITNTNDINNYIIERIRENLSSIIGGNGSNFNGDLEELTNIYNQSILNAETIAENEGARAGLGAYREATINYLNAISNRNNAFANAVKRVFGNDYAENVNQMLPNEIKNKIAQLKRILSTLKDTDETQGSGNITGSGVLNDSTWDDFAGEISIVAGDTWTGTIEPRFNGTMLGDISYQAESTPSGMIRVDSNGNVTITAPSNQTGRISGSISILSNGEIIGTKTLNITIVQDIMNLENVNNLVTIDEVGDKDPQEAISSILMNNTTIELSKWRLNNNIEMLKSDSINQAHHNIDNIALALKNAGYNEAKINSVANAVKSYYRAAINALNFDKLNDSTRGDVLNATYNFEYTGANGATCTEAGASYGCFKFRNADTALDSMDSNPPSQSSTGLQIACKTALPKQYVIRLNLASVIEKFERFYNNL